MNKKTAAFIIIGMGMLFCAYGQSLLSLAFPYGLPIQENSGMSLTMGGAAVGVAGEHNVMLKNPANLGTIDKTVFSALYSFTLTSISESSSHTNFLNPSPSQVSIGIPFGLAGTFGLSFEQRADRSAYYQSQTSFLYNGTDSGTFSQGLSARGGLVTWQAGWGYSIKKLAQIGLAYERYYLSAEQTRLSTFTFQGVTNNSRDSSKVECSGNGIRAGILVPFSRLRIGLAWEYFFRSEAGTSFSGIYPSGSTVPLANSYESKPYNLYLPPSFTLGVGYEFSPEWLVACDASLVAWNMTEVSGILAKPGTGTATGVSVGAQYIPAPNLLTPKYWETIRYRAGLRFNQLPAKDSYEYMLSVGTGFPLGRGMGLLDIGVEVGRRECGIFSGYKEDVVRFAIGFNGGHKWVQSTGSAY
jgi:hypothetical protein